MHCPFFLTIWRVFLLGYLICVSFWLSDVYFFLTIWSVFFLGYLICVFSWLSNLRFFLTISVFLNECLRVSSWLSLFFLTVSRFILDSLCFFFTLCVSSSTLCVSSLLSPFVFDYLLVYPGLCFFSLCMFLTLCVSSSLSAVFLDHLFPFDRVIIDQGQKFWKLTLWWQIKLTTAYWCQKYFTNYNIFPHLRQVENSLETNTHGGLSMSCLEWVITCWNLVVLRKSLRISSSLTRSTICLSLYV